MEENELDSIELTAGDAARALNVPYTTMLTWLDNDQVKGRQTLTRRHYVTVGALRAFLATRGAAGEEALPGLEEYVRRYIIPRLEKGGRHISTNVLSLT